MPYCPKCGREMSKTMKFCPNCGSLRDPTVIREKSSKMPDILDLISVGGILIIIGVTALRYEFNIINVLIAYFQELINYGAFIRPPSILYEPIIFFFYVACAFGIIISGIRIIFLRSTRKALSDLTGAIFAFLCAFIISNYAAENFTGHTTLAYFVVSIALVIIANAVIYFMLPETDRNNSRHDAVS
jgi:hypothetical protein